VDIRGYAEGKHRNVDDTPAGGGAGMVMRVDVLARAIDAALADEPKGRPVLYLSPRGPRFAQAFARELSEGPGAIFVCGRFEGVDERIFAARDVREVSLGDFVLSGGELAAMAVMDACVRLLPGVMGDAESHAEESFENGLLEYPHYTRPQNFEGHEIPAVLNGGQVLDLTPLVNLLGIEIPGTQINSIGFALGGLLSQGGSLFNAFDTNLIITEYDVEVPLAGVGAGALGSVIGLTQTIANAIAVTPPAAASARSAAAVEAPAEAAAPAAVAATADVAETAAVAPTAEVAVTAADVADVVATGDVATADTATGDNDNSGSTRSGRDKVSRSAGDGASSTGQDAPKRSGKAGASRAG